MNTKIVFTLLLITCFSLVKAQDIELIVRGDDMGTSRASNMASIDAYKSGILTTVELIVPGPWFLDAARLLNENPGLDVGLHLALTSEWDGIKWGPVSMAPSLVTEDGYFPTTTTDFMALEKDSADIMLELKAQIDLALRYIPHISHLSTHMFMANVTPTINSIIEALSEEYNLPVEITGVQRFGFFWNIAPDQKKANLVSFLNNLQPGLNAFGGHPCYDTEETEQLSVPGSTMDPDLRMAIHRQKVTEAFMDADVLQIIENRNIVLLSYKDVYERRANAMTEVADREVISAYPNPITDQTLIQFNMPMANQVTVEILNSAGQLEETLIDSVMLAGEQQVSWNADAYPAGIYLCRIGYDDVVEVKQLVKR